MNRPLLILLLGACPLLDAQPDTRQIRPAAAGRRVALVIGNNAYSGAPLKNAINDARAMDAALRELGFAVAEAENADLRTIEAKANVFIEGLRPGDVALFYYSGHGVQIDGENYLVPVDFHAADEADVRFQAYSALRLHERMQKTGARLSMLILDACRDNPYRASRSGAKGLAAMGNGKGSFLAFAAGPGETAADSPGQSNGLFTKHLLAELREPNLKLSELFDRVRDGVYQESGERQWPWTNSSVIGEFIFRDGSELDRQSGELEAEIARLKAELKQRDEAAQRARTEQEKRAAEQQAEAARVQLHLQEIEQAAVAKERERRAALQAEQKKRQEEEAAQQAERERRRQQDEAELAELKKTAAAPAAVATLEEARKEAASMRAKVEEITRQVNALRDRELEQLSTDLAPRREAANKGVEKDQFETSAEYQARLAKAQEQKAVFDQQAAAERGEIEQRYAAEVAAQTKPYVDRIEELRKRKYQAGSVNAEWKNYDADSQQLTVMVEGARWTAEIAPAKARQLHDLLASLRLETYVTLDGGVTEGVLVNGVSGERFPASRNMRNPKDGLTYVSIPAGTFTMGCSPGDNECDGDEKPAHEVTITKGVWLGQTEVTQEAYRRVRGTNPSHFKGPKLPVETVTWDEARGFCQAAGMRLSTEAEWEYAARAGSTGSRYGDLDRVAWNTGNSGDQTHEVGQKLANAWGLYDMLGNVWEWTADWYSSYSGDSQSDPQGPASGTQRVLRGGSWFVYPGNVRASGRDGVTPEGSNYSIGFRCAGN